MRTEDRQALVARLIADYPLFASSTIERWVVRTSAPLESGQRRDSVSSVGRAVRTTLEELSRAGVTTSRELPVAPPAAPGRCHRRAGTSTTISSVSSGRSRAIHRPSLPG